MMNMFTNTHTVHMSTHQQDCRQRRACSRILLGLAPQSPGGSIITHVPPPRQPPAGLHSALLVLTQPDTPVACGASYRSCSKPTTIVVAANWLCVGPWVTARSAIADTFFPLVSGKALLSPLLRPQPATEPHMPGHVGPAQPASPSGGSSCPTHCWEKAEIAQQTGLVLRWAFAQGVQCDSKVMKKAPSTNVYAKPDAVPEMPPSTEVL